MVRAFGYTGMVAGRSGTLRAWSKVECVMIIVFIDKPMTPNTQKTPETDTWGGPRNRGYSPNVQSLQTPEINMFAVPQPYQYYVDLGFVF